MSKIYHPDCKSLITSMYVKNGLIAILFLIASIFGVVVMREWKILLIGLMCAAYFIFQIYEIHNDEKNERYKTVKGIVVSDESSKNMIRQQISTYRIIPVNEDGEFIDKNGKYDFFLSVNESTAVKNDDTIVPADTQKSVPSMSPLEAYDKVKQEAEKEVIEQKKKHTKENLVFLDGFGEGGDSK